MRHTAESEKVGGGPRGTKVLQHAEVKVTLVLKGTARREYLSGSGILQKGNVLTDNRRIASEAKCCHSFGKPRAALFLL